jgi:hypothetical protein
MGLPQIVRRMFMSVVPTSNRAGGGTYTSVIPRGTGVNPGATAAFKQALGGVAGKYGSAVALAATIPAETWVEEIIVQQGTATTGTGTAVVGLFTATGTPTASADIVAEVPVFLDATTAALSPAKRVKVDPPAYFVAGTNICAAVAHSGGAKKARVMAVISRNK